jgi:predicted MFS family arabinose efflux permease
VTPLWRNKAYMLLWAGQTMSTLGNSATSVVYPLLVLSLTNSPAAAGAAAALRALPYLLLSLHAGALADRLDRKRVMAICDGGRALAALSLPAAMLAGMLTVEHVLLVCWVDGCLFVFFNVAEVAALSRVVPAAQLPQAVAQNEASFGAIHVAGPSLGAWLWQAFGRGMPFMVNGLCYLVSLWCILRNRASFQPETSSPQAPVGRDVLVGLAWLWRRPLLRFLACLAGGLNLADAAIPLIIVVAARELKLSEAEIGMVFGAGGAGAVLGSMLGGAAQRFASFGVVLSLALWAQLAAVPGYALASNAIGLAATYAFTCLSLPVFNVVQFSYRLRLIPDELQGRVNSSFRMLAFGMYPVGAALSGILIEQCGVVHTVTAVAVWILLLAVCTSLNGHVRAAPRHDAWSQLGEAQQQGTQNEAKDGGHPDARGGFLGVVPAGHQDRQAG